MQSEGTTLLDKKFLVSSQVCLYCDLKCLSETTPHLLFTLCVCVCVCLIIYM